MHGFSHLKPLVGRLGIQRHGLQDLAARAQRMGFPVSELIRDQRAPR